MKSRDRQFHWDNPQDAENEVTIYVTQDDRLRIGVAEERAVDSYNETFECEVIIPTADAKRLRDYLNREFPD